MQDQEAATPSKEPLMVVLALALVLVSVVPVVVLVPVVLVPVVVLVCLHLVVVPGLVMAFLLAKCQAVSCPHLSQLSKSTRACWPP